LRQSVYSYAVTLEKTSTGVTPALLSSTALDMFSALLDPDEHINGSVPLSLRGTIPVGGIGQLGSPSGVQLNIANVRDGSGTGGTSGGTTYARAYNPDVNTSNYLIRDKGTNGNNARPDLPVNLANAIGTGFNLNDLANAETMDRLTRAMRDVIDSNPVDGEEQIVRWAHGLRIDDASVPFLLAKRTAIFGQDLLKAMDGAGIEGEVTQSRLMQRISFTVPVPVTELGGVVVTFLVVKPDEVLKEQPHPVLSQPWGFDNLVAQELELDPVAVTGRQVQASVPQANEDTVMFYTGFNELRRTYVNWGWNRHVDPATVDAKNALWQYEIPASVTPENIVYPPDISHFPFVDQDAEIARYLISSTYVGKSPIFVGPSPVETVSVIETEDLFGDADGAQAEAEELPYK